MNRGPSSTHTAAQAQLMAIADELRPDLHRYCARLMGSVIEGEDVVQDTFIRAYAALQTNTGMPNLRPWLFQIAHNRSLDLLRSRAVRRSEPLEAASEIADVDSLDPEDAYMRKEAIDTAISRFVQLPTTQRSVVILKDVLDQTLEEIANVLGLTINAVKAHLARGRSCLKAINEQATTTVAPSRPSPEVARYVALFNQRDWDGLRTMLADDVRLKQSAYPERVGAADVGMFFGIYSRSPTVHLAPAWLDGREVVAVWENSKSQQPDYFMWLEWKDGRISFIRDYRHVRYVVDDAAIVVCPDA